MTLDIITDPSLRPVRHGFFARQGGASSGVFSGLNCGAGSSDQRDIVAINRARAAAAMGVEPERLVGAHQTHSSHAEIVDAPPTAPIRADGLATATAGLSLSVLTADCMPILLADARAGVIGVAHAGWRGAAAGIIEATVAAMRRLGASGKSIVAVIGPTISQRNYEVGPELFDEIAVDDPDAARFFAGGSGDRMQFDLPGYGLSRLRAAGVEEAVWTGHCTYADEARFYSYRRSVHRREADYGRMIAAICL